jgi:hypothetical protein
MAAMAEPADTADIMANTPNILARCRREADTSSAEAGRNSAAANRKNTATRAVAIGAAKAGVALIGVAATGAAVTDLSSSVDLVIRTTGVGTPLGAGAFLTRLATAIILMGIILRMGTVLVIRPTRMGTPIGPGAFPTRITTAMILTGITLRMGTILVTTATPLTEAATDLRLPNCSAGWPKLATTVARSMG